MTGQGSGHPGRAVVTTAWIRAITSAAIVIALYAVVPLRATDWRADLVALRVAALCLGLAALTWLAAVQVRRALHSRSLAERIALLLTLVTFVMTFFAAVYYVLAGQFEGITTRLDALYFSMATLCTVGYGDIVPLGQAARAIVVVQMTFDLIILTTAITIVISALAASPD
jgi:hypothetical protein